LMRGESTGVRGGHAARHESAGVLGLQKAASTRDGRHDKEALRGP
jgi:hypothetical protein